MLAFMLMLFLISGPFSDVRLHKGCYIAYVDAYAYAASEWEPGFVGRPVLCPLSTAVKRSARAQYEQT